METYDEKGNVLCRVCGKSFVKIPPFHLSVHGLTTKQYKETYPDAPFIGKNYVYRKLKPKDPIVTAEELLSISDIPDIMTTQDIIKDDDIEHIPKVPKIEEIKDMEDLREAKAEPVKSLKERESLPDGKYEIFVFLKGFFPDIQNNYFIEKMDLEKHLIYRCVTDITDTEKKLVFDFPNAMWHNTDPQSEGAKKQTLKLDGWKLVQILSRNPSVQDVVETLKSNGLF